MQAERYISNDPDEIVAVKKRDERATFASLFMLIMLLVGFFKDFKTIKDEPILWIIFFILTLILLLTSFITSKKIQFIINKKGFWTKKHDFILWEDIWYFYIKEQEIRARSYNTTYYHLKFKLKENDKTITIKFDKINHDIENIQKSIRLYTKKFNIHDLGYDIERN